MKNRISALLFCTLAALSAPCHSFDSAPTADELIIWEIQDWKPNGGYKRLTLWRAGYSEIEVVPRAKLTNGKNPYRAKPGWEMIREGDRVRFVHRSAYTPNQALIMFRNALRAGIRRLKSFRPTKTDAGGTRLVINLEGKRKEILIPFFTGRYRGTTNHKRYLAVSKVLGHFDTDAFEGPGAKPAAKPKPKPKPEPATEPATAADDKTTTKTTAEPAAAADDKTANEAAGKPATAAETEPEAPPSAEPATTE
jgi:hypothetical protein